MKKKSLKFTFSCITLSFSLLATLHPLKAYSIETTVAQQKDNYVTGTVNDNAGAVIGATVYVKGSNTGTITDIDGKFSISAPSGSTLVISYIGYKSQEIRVGDKPLNILLKEDSKSLDEVVVTALGVKRERKADRKSVV